ncbi:MAG: NAD(P)H-dependent glycerol-3-phosphate dehydrogenase [Methylococcales bacterium]|nr:NAD(P)H-dependent glycerol-3-phosphate dehydrogenase [Methylococcales bacterium]
MKISRLSVLGAGSWGTALAMLAARNGLETLLWGHNATHVQHLHKARSNAQFLPGYEFPERLTVTDQMAECALFGDTFLVAVPSHAFRETLEKLAACCQDCRPNIAWATKGFSPEDESLLQETVYAIFGATTPAAVLSGPSFALEVAAGLPTAITVAANRDDFAQAMAQVLHGGSFRAYTSCDMVGVQVGGAVKNVLAIAAGVADGLNFGANTRAALITRGLHEILLLGLKLGGRQDTFMGLAGLGDLILTCTDDQSRNRRFGLALGQGKTPAQARQEINQEVEGFSAALAAWRLAQRYRVDMPITEQTYKVLYEGQSPLAGVQNLLLREPKSET